MTVVRCLFCSVTGRRNCNADYEPVRWFPGIKGFAHVTCLNEAMAALCESIPDTPIPARFAGANVGSEHVECQLRFCGGSDLDSLALPAGSVMMKTRIGYVHTGCWCYLSRFANRELGVDIDPLWVKLKRDEKHQELSHVRND